MAEKRLIDANALIELVANELWAYEVEQFEHYVSKTPTVDAVEVVRCKDCLHYEFGVCLKIYSDGNVSADAWQEWEPDDFCSYGEKREV